MGNIISVALLWSGVLVQSNDMDSHKNELTEIQEKQLNHLKENCIPFQELLAEKELGSKWTEPWLQGPGCEASHHGAYLTAKRLPNQEEQLS